MCPRRAAALLLVVGLAATGCPKIVVVDRPSCDACHRPLSEDGTWQGIEEAHPPVNGRAFLCTDCHGGDPDDYHQSKAHVSVGTSGPSFLKSLTTGQLYQSDPAYLRFVNPGDLRVASMSCGSGSSLDEGSGCHQGILDTVIRNQMATFSGELGVARFRAGEQSRGAGVKGIYDVRDPDFVIGEVPGTVGSLGKMQEPVIAEGETTIGPYQDLYLTKACMRCHLWSFGDNKFPGDFRSSGCSACHMVYADDGLSHSKDPAIRKAIPPHPIEHTLTKKIPSNQCMHCHYRGGRIGPSIQGYREGAGAGFDSDSVGFLGQALHGHDASFYIVDEDTTNRRDETPPDVHFEAGMDCIDCHTQTDVHGDGKIYADTMSAIEVRCESCHGTIDAPSTLTTARGAVLSHLERDAEDRVWLTTKVRGLRLQIPQIALSVAQASTSSTLHRSMGRDANGFSHTDSLQCYTCHSGWVPTCFGCHVSVDMSKSQRSLISGESTPGQIAGTRKWVATDDLILITDTRGRIAPSMPSERMFFNVKDGNGQVIIDNQVRVSRSGEPGMGHRAFQPHTIRRWSPFMRCDRCHPVETTFENMAVVNQVIGLGTDKYLETDGAGTVWALDRVLSDTFEPEVLIGHDEPKVSAPLTAAVINRMLAVEVPLPRCEIPADVFDSLAVIQAEIFTPKCATPGCHVAPGPEAGLDLSAGKSRDALVGRVSAVKDGAILIVAGDPDASYIMDKLTDAVGIEGDPMPGEGDILLQCELDAIANWIFDGAKN